jgi:hypothetical protein
MCFIDFRLLSITLNILTTTNVISFMTTSCNCSYRHVSLFSEFDDKFDKLDKDCCTSMFNVECIVKSSCNLQCNQLVHSFPPIVQNFYKC